MEASIAYGLILAFFSIGYLAIIFEFIVKLNKTAVALFTGVICWTIYFLGNLQPLNVDVADLAERLSDTSEILFFLLGAMTLVELIDSHNGFQTVMRLIHTQSKRHLLWTVSFFAFFLSALLDNLTTTILMISILKKLVPNKKSRLTFSCMVIIAANAGGAWTPIGDVTTTMLWIQGQITTLKVMNEIFFPSLICMLVPLLIYTYSMKKGITLKEPPKIEEKEPGAKLVFVMGIASLLLVPIFHWATGMPPYMAILIALSILWFVTDILHNKYEHRQHLRIPHILTKVDVSNILFFLGILMTIDALDSIGFLENVAGWLQTNIGYLPVTVTLIGMFSAIIDNVPLVAATMGMYSLEQYPQDSNLWMMIAYAAGTGGSLLLIGSSAGVAMMGIEKINFFQYMKKASIPALAGFLAGMVVYLISLA
ncbi:MAG: sodium:proton antiporter NhaD [Chlamydiales bacterium]